MTNAIAIVLGLTVACAVTADLLWNGSAASLFLAKQGLRLIGWLAFWR
jgi:hypothetical protein